MSTPPTAGGAAGTVADLAERLRAGERRALAQAITLVESTRADHREAAEALLEAVMPGSGATLRLAVSGVPGVGKSTFIEAFGLHALERERRVAVLTVDPSSALSGGSILGDKTRMQRLGASERAFVRPSAAGGTLGGVHRRTRESVALCEAAGYDLVLIETVGVGQSETAAVDMSDMFLLLLLPGGGDELQGIKRGIVELADLVLVNKADGELEPAAGRTAADYRNALRLLRPRSPEWEVPVQTCSAVRGTGIGDAWERVLEFEQAARASGALAARRAEQASRWMDAELSSRLEEALARAPGMAARLEQYRTRVRSGELAPSVAARRIVDAFLGRA